MVNIKEKNENVTIFSKTHEKIDGKQTFNYGNGINGKWNTFMSNVQ